MSPRTSALVLFAALAFFPALARAQPFHLDDSLRGSTSGHASGGSFGADGWTVTAATDRIWYALPRLASGYVEFTVAHVTPATLPLPDHEIFAMYEDGYGIGEPIAYSPAFRGNAYKVLVRIYGMVEPSRVGSMKLMWGMCPSGAPGYDACGCASFFDEPFANPGAWTGDPVRIRVEWGGGHSRLLRDGVEVVSVDWTGFTFGPSDLHMMLGSPRNDGGLSAMPLGATFSDLVVDGQQGPLATCAGSTVDAGAPPPDAGMCSAGTAIADATAAVWEPGVFPDARDLNVEGDASGPSAVVYLRFPPASGVVTHATLTMNTSGSPSAAGGSGQVCAVTGGTWDEATLTWSNRPTVSTRCTGGAHAVTPSEAVTFDVTSLITTGAPIDLAIVSSDPDGAHYLSRESGGCTLGPRLDVSSVPSGDGGPPPDAGTTRDASTDASSSSDAAASDAHVDAATRGGGLSNGCGCGVARARSTTPIALLLVLIAARMRRRQPRIIDSSRSLPSR